ncbi:unnamed protein product, partial [Ectocarpus sp. 12 AP-2014]
GGGGGGGGGKGRLSETWILSLHYMRELAFGVYKMIGTQIDSMVQGSETQLR